MGCTPQDAFQGMIDAHKLPATWRELQIKSDEIFLSIMPDMLQPMPGLFRLLDHLDALGIPHAVCTSSNPELVYKMLPIHDLERRFDFILTSADVTHGKPHPEMYLRAAERFGVEPASMMVLEDSYNGCLAGANAGAFVVAVPGEHSQDQDFSMANLVAKTLDDERIMQIL
jgi:HAD superfamily hydrolase (TIGR01509 family)